jgi:hypothetical protein
MFKRVLLLAATGIVLGASLATAGGQATIKVSALPSKLVAGKATTVSFTIVNAVGQPLSDLSPVVIAKRGAERFQVRARALEQPGAYAADLKLPAGRDWTLTVDSRYCGNTHVMRGIEVVAAN